jgi:hypothetical protein
LPGASAVTERLEIIFVESVMVANFVQDCDPDLLA